MAAQARDAQNKRIIEVNRKELISKLESNLVKHVTDYNEAMAGYKTEALAKLEESKKDAYEKLAKAIKRAQETIEECDVEKLDDTYMLIQQYYVQLKLPQNYEKEYKVAIEMFKWDTRDIIELTSAEFTCFVLDQWDWKDEFTKTTGLYALKKV